MTASRAAEQRWQSWQSIDSARLLLAGVAGALVAVALARTAVMARDPHHVALAFGLFIGFGELLRLALPGNRQAAPIGLAAALAYAMVLQVAPLNGVHPVMVQIPALQVIAVTAIAMAIGALPQLAAGRSAHIWDMAIRLVTVAFVAFVFRPLADTRLIQDDHSVAFAVMVVVAALGLLLQGVIEAVLRAEDLRARYSVALADEIRVRWRLSAALGISAIIMVFGAQVMGLLELAIFAAPLLVIQLAFRKYSQIRSTYLQTVRALSRVTEVAGYVDADHSNRVSKLALAVGRELGMPEPDLLDLEYAALMHDIGQLSLPDPIPGGATSSADPMLQGRIAQLGADVIKRTQVLDAVAELVRCQAMPWRGVPARRSAAWDAELEIPPLGSRIIRAVNAFDDLVEGRPGRDRANAALGRLRADSEREYDPEVIAALAVVTNRLPVSRL